MYIVYRKDYYKYSLLLGVILCLISWIPIYLLIAVYDHSWDLFSILSLFISITYTLYCLVKYLRKDLDFIVLRIDDVGLYLCGKKDEGVFVSWKNIKLIIFVRDDYGSKIIVRQHNKETHELILTYYFYVFRPKSAINAAYKYADDKKKIKEVKDSLALDYEAIMWRISKTEVKHES